MTSIDFSQFPQPESNDSGSVGAALDALRAAHDQSSSDEAYDQVLWALGDNHKRTFYPVVLAVLPHIEQIIAVGGVWARDAAIEALIDLGGSFVPEKGHEEYLGASVKETVRAFIHAMRPKIAPLALGADAYSQGTIELLEMIDDQTI